MSWCRDLSLYSYVDHFRLLLVGSASKESRKRPRINTPTLPCIRTGYFPAFRRPIYIFSTLDTPTRLYRTTESRSHGSIRLTCRALYLFRNEHLVHSSKRSGPSSKGSPCSWRVLLSSVPPLHSTLGCSLRELITYSWHLLFILSSRSTKSTDCSTARLNRYLKL